MSIPESLYLSVAFTSVSNCPFYASFATSVANYIYIYIYIYILLYICGERERERERERETGRQGGREYESHGHLCALKLYPCAVMHGP